MELDLLLDDSSQIKEIRDLINIKDLTKSRDASIEFGIEIKFSTKFILKYPNHRYIDPYRVV